MKQNKKPYKIAITGGIGSGKSTVLSILQELGYMVFSCDAIARDIYNDKLIFAKIAKSFPNVVENDVINRKKLAEEIFNDAMQLQTLNAITHPVIMQNLLQKMQSCRENICFAEVPLLFEGGFENLFDHVFVIMRPLENRIQSIKLRDNLLTCEIEKRIKNQFNYANPINIVHTIIENTKDVEYLEYQIQKVLHEIEKMDNCH